MRLGCRDFVLQLGTSIISALLIIVGTILLIFGISSSTPSSSVRVALLILAVGVVAYVFLKIGQGIWRDLKSGSTPEEEVESSTDSSGKE